MSAGSSDWVVFSGSQGYPEGEAEFLKFIIEMIYRQMRAHPEVDEKMLKDWVAARRKQVESEDLVFIAHQIDFLLRKEG